MGRDVLLISLLFPESPIFSRMRIYEFSTPLSQRLSLKEVESFLRAKFSDDTLNVIVKRSIDARKEVMYRYRCELYTGAEDFTPYTLPPYNDVHNAESVIVVGAGPAGLFAALRLLMMGLKPIILERGKDVHSRKRDVALLSREGVLDPDSNYCYGEGGAGTFSDGKLYTRSSKRGDNREVLYQFVSFGVSEDILIDAHPHIGSDRLPSIIENIRECIIAHGGEYHFNSKVVSISLDGGFRIVRCADGSEFHSRAVVLASGHSGKDIYQMLSACGGALQAKGFALGVRVEHPQELINRAQYHTKWKKGYPSAEYSFVQQIDGRGVFSFCMCPGGVLVPSSTEPGTVVLNGMSNSFRNSLWANSGVVVQVEPEDVPGDSAFRLLDFQMEMERSMYLCARSLTGSNANPFTAPAQRMVDFCRGHLSESLPRTSYSPGVVSAPLHLALPSMVAKRLQKAFPKVRIGGYYTNEALLLGVESRTSSPIRLPRDPQTLEYVSMKGIFPCGEGAGYAGGIVSSAVDGIRAAISVATLLGKN